MSELEFRNTEAPVEQDKIRKGIGLVWAISIGFLVFWTAWLIQTWPTQNFAARFISVSVFLFSCACMLLLLIEIFLLTNYVVLATLERKKWHFVYANGTNKVFEHGNYFAFPFSVFTVRHGELAGLSCVVIFPQFVCIPGTLERFEEIRQLLTRPK